MLVELVIHYCPYFAFMTLIGQLLPFFAPESALFYEFKVHCDMVYSSSMASAAAASAVISTRT